MKPKSCCLILVYIFNKKNNKIKLGIVVDASNVITQETDGRIVWRKPVWAQQQVSGQDELCSKIATKGAMGGIRRVKNKNM